MAKRLARRLARRRPNAFALAAGLGFAGLHAGITLSYRLPMLFAASLTAQGKKRHARELNRMVSEKAAAMAEGAFAAQKETLRLVRAGLRPRSGFAALAQAPVTIADTALRPAMRKVKANSRRLSKRR
jgi:hypothetical protein